MDFLILNFIDVEKKYLKSKNDLIIEIGSNDGIFLDPLRNLGINAIGVEPAKNIAKIANSKKLVTMPEYFSNKTVNKIMKKFVKSLLIIRKIQNNVALGRILARFTV